MKLSDFMENTKQEASKKLENEFPINKLSCFDEQEKGLIMGFILGAFELGFDSARDIIHALTENPEKTIPESDDI